MSKSQIIQEGDRTYYPLSPAQKSLFLASMFTLEPEAVKESNTLNPYFYIKENCDLDAMEKSLNYVLQLHDSLRLRIVKKGFRKMQYIAPYEYYRPERVQLPDEAAFREYLQNISSIPVAMYNDSMVSARLVRVGETGGALVIRFFHACTDGYSHTLYYPELEYAYEEYAAGRTPKQPEQVYSVVEYFHEVERYRNSEQRKVDMKYWYHMFLSQRRFSFPAGRRSPHNDASEEEIHIQGDLYQKLYDTAKGNKSTLQSILMLIDAMAFWVLTGKDNFCFYTLYHGRATPVLRQTVGCMFNNLPVFFDLDGSSTFLQAVNQTRANYKETLSHGQLPMTEYLPATYKEAILHGFNFNPGWFLVSLALQGSAARARKYEFSDVRSEPQPYQFYNTIHYIEGEEVVMKLAYQTRRFTREQVMTFLNLVHSLVDLAVNNPEMTLAELKDAGQKIAPKW